MYLKQYPDITTKEKRNLAKWLKAGHSPETNDCNLCDDRGYPLDFIDARHTEQDLIQQHMIQPTVSEQTDVDSTDDSFELLF